MLLSVVIPVYNETALLMSRLQQVITFLEKSFSNHFELIVVDDGSQDRVESYLIPSVQVIRNEKNGGKGYSITRGVEKASGQYIFFMDSDLSTPLKYLPPLLDRLQNGADIVVASRFEKGSIRFLSWAERTLIRTLTGVHFSDTQCGFKGFTNSAAKKLFSLSRIHRFCFDVEILFLAALFSLKVESYPVEWRHNPHSTVRWQDIFIFVWDLLRIRWHAWRGTYRIHENTPFFSS